jgi:hypothetical protein
MRTGRFFCMAVLLCCFIFFAASPVWAGSNSALPSSVFPLSETFTITPVPDTLAGNPVRYNIDFSVPLFSISFAWGYVAFTGAQQDTLALQLKTLGAGEYSFTWDSIVPAGASGTATVVIQYFAFPGRRSAQSATYEILQETTPTQEYIGSKRCMGCHTGFTPEVVNAYTQSGHYYALSPASYKAPAYPSFAPGVPQPPPGNTWANISYVIGGYAWSANFSSAVNGKILTGPEAQYNLASDYLGTPAGFVPYSPDSPDPGLFNRRAIKTGYPASQAPGMRTALAAKPAMAPEALMCITRMR